MLVDFKVMVVVINEELEVRCDGVMCWLLVRFDEMVVFEYGYCVCECFR